MSALSKVGLPEIIPAHQHSPDNSAGMQNEQILSHSPGKIAGLIEIMVTPRIQKERGCAKFKVTPTHFQRGCLCTNTRGLPHGKSRI